MEKVAKVLVGIGVYILLPFAIIKVSWELATSWIEELVHKKYLATLRSKLTTERLDVSGVHKRGGAVKMASGGMTASRRGDGIASRGKTRCKMY